MQNLTRLLSLSALVLATVASTGTALADHGYDGKSLDGTSTTWDCNQIDFTAGAVNTEIYSLPTGTGDADLVVYKWVSGAWSKVCTSATGTNQENCNTAVGDGAASYLACIDGYSANFTQFQLLAGYSMANSAATATIAGDGNYYINYFKDNLFLGIAHHRIGCLSDTTKTVSDKDYDGFSDADYCRKGEAWNGANNHGAKYMATECGGGECYAHIGTTLSAATSKADTCGTEANNLYGTANYARRSTTCSYNVLKNCNSDCWIRKFSNCMGMQIPILSPCA